MSGIKIRGIYSTALTNLLLKNKFKIAQPSDNIKENFKNKKFEEDVDTTMYDTNDKSGVVIKGKQTDKICSLFQKKFKNVIITKESVGHIYKGRIIRLDPNTKNIHVDLGLDKVGLLPLKDYWGFVKEGEKILVQFKNEERDHILLSTKIHLFGNNMILIQKGFTKISNTIKDKATMERLSKLAEENSKNGWGILWKSGAAEKEDKELIKEIEELYKKFDEIQKRFESEEDVKLLSEGMTTAHVRFDKEARELLDETRREIKPTIEMHHRLKNDMFMNIVDFSENLIKSGVNEKKINKEVKLFIDRKRAKQGDLYLLVEYKPDQSAVYLKGKIEETGDDNLKIKRFLKAGTIIPIVNISVERGDYLLNIVKEGEWFVRNELYSKDDELKAVFYTVNSPIEILSTKAIMNSYNVAVLFDEGKEILGLDNLKALEEKGVVTKDLVKKVEKVCKGIKE